MAERRMFAKTIIDSDAFLEMPQSTQLLYFHLSMRADDEGFINNPKSTMRSVGCKEDDMSLLIVKKFVIPFESGVVVIKHWKIHNYIQSDRFTPTKYLKEKEQLELDENKAYRMPNNQSNNECIQNGYGMDTQVRLGKVSIDKNNKDIGVKSTRFIPPTLELVQSYITENNYTVDAERFIDFYESKGWYVGKNKMKDWKAAVRTWAKDKPIQSKRVGRVEQVTQYDTPTATITKEEEDKIKQVLGQL